MGIKEFLNRIANLSEVREIYHDEKGRPQMIIKGDEDSRSAGLEYGLEALGTRLARGDSVEDWEINALVEKAKTLKKITDPDIYVRKMIDNWSRNPIVEPGSNLGSKS